MNSSFSHRTLLRTRHGHLHPAVLLTLGEVLGGHGGHRGAGRAGDGGRRVCLGSLGGAGHRGRGGCGDLGDGSRGGDHVYSGTKDQQGSARLPENEFTGVKGRRKGLTAVDKIHGRVELRACLHTYTPVPRTAQKA